MNGFFYLFYNSDVASHQNLSNNNKKRDLVFVISKSRFSRNSLINVGPL